MRVILNIIWLLGIWMAIAYAIASALLFITIIGIPFGVQSFKLAVYALWPFGRALVPSATRGKAISVVGNILWFVLAGWWLALGHLFTGILLCLTIIGIPLGIASFKMAGAALVPFGKEIVPPRALAKARLAPLSCPRRGARKQPEHRSLHPARLLVADEPKGDPRSRGCGRGESWCTLSVEQAASRPTASGREAR